MVECPYIKDCKQMIDEERFERCLGEVEDWSFENCNKYHDNGPELNEQEPVKTPKEWQEEA